MTDPRIELIREALLHADPADYARMRAAADVLDSLAADLERFAAVERARLAALRCVRSVIRAEGDYTPSVLLDAHRILATGMADEDRARLAPEHPSAQLTDEPAGES